ncbi:MAG: Set3 complex subunit with deacetylase activity, meiotic-specific repressor of sporulation proteins [Watsoniomyces obsoletus]|nr:MAG: Set3 complex subunit with deacetylase activity, meiotic-specific repressor of sporulation proteins [Watsoniomyces obsoletus]
MGAEHWLRAAFLGTTGVMLLAWAVPTIRHRYMGYGPRTTASESPSQAPEKSSQSSSTASESPSHAQEKSFQGSSTSWLKRLDRALLIQVPHGWFAHFYTFSVLLSAFWAAQLLSSGTSFRKIASLELKGRTPANSMSMNQLVLTWALVAIQGCRRLYETIAFAKPSNATMPIGHYILGLLYYLGVSMAVWVEGIATVRAEKFRGAKIQCETPSAHTLAFLILFLVASVMQHVCHRHLASLKKYTLPNHPLFRYLICPHYTAECLIYLALTGIAAPQGHWINWSFFSVLVFVLTNLGATAESTRLFYQKKFGAESIRKRWRMIPFIY